MKHLLCEHQNTISELKADRLISIEAVQKEQEQLEAELRKEMKAAMVGKEKLDNENLVTQLEMVCSTHQVLKICGFNVSLYPDIF